MVSQGLAIKPGQHRSGDATNQDRKIKRGFCLRVGNFFALARLTSSFVNNRWRGSRCPKPMNSGCMPKRP
jgi:hypothetical protein